MRWATLGVVLLLAGCSFPDAGDGGGSVPTSATATPSPSPTASPSPTPSVAPTATPPLEPFDGQRAYDRVVDQVLYENGSVRTRVPGTPGNTEVAAYIAGTLADLGWTVTYHHFNATYGCKRTPMHNVLAERPGTSGDVTMLAAHYDTRPIADKDPDPDNRSKPIPGAIDGGSGVAILLELARVMPPTEDTVRLAFWDGEDGGGYLGNACTDWILGSTAYNDQLIEEERARIRAYVLVDMVGDPQVTIPWEAQSDIELRDQVFGIAERLGYGHVFVQKPGWSITDDHTPFARSGVPVLDLIHTSIPPAQPVFPEWHHTMHDDIFHVSPATLAIVGHTLQVWLDEHA